MDRDMEKEMQGYLDNAFRRSIAKVIIINCLNKRKSYPYALVKVIGSIPTPALKGLSKSDIYNIISSLENDGFIKGKVVLSGAKAKKVYSVTLRGSKVAHNSRKLLMHHILAMKKLVKEEFNE